MKSELRLFSFFLKSLKKSNQNPLLRQSSELIKQTSVALIFRINPNLKYRIGINHEPQTLPPKDLFVKSLNSLENSLKDLDLDEKTNASHLFEILMIKRGSHQKDRHGGQIAFPGGKCEPNENDFGAVKREVSEEVGLDLRDHSKNLSLGKIELNTWAYYHEPYKSTFISLYVFFSEGDTDNLKLDEEVEKAFWQPFSRFLDRSRLKKDINFSRSHNYFFANPKIFSLFDRFFLKNLESRVYKIFLLDNGEKFWGISFGILMHVLGLISKEASSDWGLSDERKQIQLLLKRCFDIDFFVRRKYLPGYSKIKGYVIKRIFDRNRIRQFQVK